MSNKDRDFVHLHVHTDFSLLDGCSRIDCLCERASELGMKALSITDHGVPYGLTRFFKQAEKQGIKPLLGCEIYLVYEESIADTREGMARQKSNHMGLLARNFKGYQNLCKIVSKAHTKGFYRNPRTDLKTLAEHSEGLIAFSGCLAAVIPRFLIEGNYKAARDAAARFIDIFGKEYFIIELMDHGIEEQQRIIPDLIKLAHEFDLKIVATNDVHYVNQSDWQPHDSLLCIQTGSRLKDEKRMRYDSHQFNLKSREEMELVFRDHPKSITNTCGIAEMCELKLPFGENHYPVFQQPHGLNLTTDNYNFDRILDLFIESKNAVLERENKDKIELDEEQKSSLRKNGLYLFELSKRGLEDRYGANYNKIRNNPENASADDIKLCSQLDHELAIIIGTGFADYFLIVWDFIRWAREQGIPVGPGRGSGAGCVVAYVLKITDIDPLRFGLLFERMLNLERVSPPDFDVDFCMRRRDEVVNYVREKYGRDRVANIITFGTFGAKMIIRDLARVNDIDYSEANKIAKMVPDELNITLDKAVIKSSELKEEILRNPIAKSIVEQGRVIEGMVRNTGKHACGVIIADQPIINLIPVTLQEGDLTTQYPKGPSEELGLLKMDFLGLKTLTVISDAQENIRYTRNLPDFNVEQIPLDDPKTYRLLNTGRTTGVFQLESGGMQNLCRRIELSKFEEIIALIALYRPGPMQFIDQFIEGKKDPKSIQIPHPLLKDLVSETYGVLVYQEQVIQAAQIIAGYTPGSADILRRAMGKKIKQVMNQQRNVFIEGAKKHNKIERKKAEEIFGILEKFAEYGFNKSHSAAYAMLSYRTAYLKANFPVEFMAAVLTSEQGNADKISNFLEECSSMQLPVMSPEINTSRSNFTPVHDEKQKGFIRFGLAAVKNIGGVAAKGIIEERELNGPYISFKDFVVRQSDKNVNRRVLEALIKTGAFDSMNEDRATLLHNLESEIADATARHSDILSGQASLFDMLECDSDSSSLNNGSSTYNKIHEMPINEKLQHEKELLGFYISGHPMDSYIGLDTAIDSFTNPDELTHLENNTKFRLGGIIGNLQIKYTRKQNRQMGIFSLSTRSNTFEMIAFPETFEKCGDRLIDGKLCMINGLISRRNGETNLVVHQVSNLGHSVSKMLQRINFILYPNDDATQFISLMRDTIDNNSGGTQIDISFLINQQIIDTNTAQSLTLMVTDQIFKSLHMHPAVAGYRIETMPIQHPDEPNHRVYSKRL